MRARGTGREEERQRDHDIYPPRLSLRKIRGELLVPEENGELGDTALVIAANVVGEGRSAINSPKRGTCPSPKGICLEMIQHSGTRDERLPARSGHAAP